MQVPRSRRVYEVLKAMWPGPFRLSQCLSCCRVKVILAKDTILVMFLIAMINCLTEAT